MPLAWPRRASTSPRVLWTNDEGHSWHQAAVPEDLNGDIHDLFFVDAEGWLTLWNVGREGSSLLHSIDGGRQWVAHTIPKVSGNSQFIDAVRFLSHRVGIAFVESDAGSGLRPVKQATALLTTDGGETWKEYPLPAPVQSCDVVTTEVWCSSGMGILKIRVTP